jgi:hypothetical protein
MKRSNVNAGTRAEVLAELDQYGADRAAHGKEAAAREYARAIADLEAGETVVRVRHSVWFITDDGSSPDDGEVCQAAVQTAPAR